MPSERSVGWASAHQFQHFPPPEKRKKCRLKGFQTAFAGESAARAG
ncbi:TPA: hypothetical protein ACFRG5_001249 [Neisseria lactamica]